MTPAWKQHCPAETSGPKCRQPPGQQASVPKCVNKSNQWNSEKRFRATYPPTGCRTFGKPPLGPCHFDEPRHHHVNNGFHTTHAENSPVRPRIVTVVRPGGRKHLRKITILLNRRSVQTFEQLVADISEALGYPRWKNDRVKKLFNLKGREIRSVSDFFRSDEVFVASGRDKLSLEDIEEVLEELYPDSPCYHSVVLQTWERVLEQPVNTSKADSGFNEEVEPIRSLVPPITNSSQRAGGKACQEERQRAKLWERDRRDAQQSEKTQTIRAKEGALLKEKIEKLNAIYAPCASYCKNCKRGRAGKERGDLIRRRVSSPARDNQVTEKQSQVVRRAPQRFSRSVHVRPWEGPNSRENNATKFQEQRDGLHPLGEKETESGKATEESPSGIKEAQEADTEERVQNPPTDEQNIVVKENGLAPLAVLEHSPEDNSGDNSLQEQQGEREEGATETVVQTENHKTEEQQENDHDALLPVGQVVTHSTIEQDYEIGRIIGDGNFAVVRECKLRETNVPYAMKIIDKEKLKGKEHMIQNEISIVRSLSHPHVVKLLWDYDTEDQIYLVMELVPGGDLFDAITEKVKFSETQASLMVRDVCEALAYIHSKSIVHRDLKPENLLVQHNPDGSSTLKLADFGLAMVVTEPIFTVCGTPTYVAPEILTEKGYGLPVDMWATGVILYILLCGFPPFRSQEKDQDELFELIQKGEYEFLPPYWDDISEGAKGLIGGLLQAEPEGRLTAKQALHHPWVQSGAEEDSNKEGAKTIDVNSLQSQHPVSDQQTTEQ